MSIEVIKKYQEEYKEFAKIDDFNMDERLKSVPAQKHNWVARLHNAKIDRHILTKQKNKLRTSLIEKMMEDSPVNLDKKTLDKIDNTPQFEDINEKLKELELLIGYLEDVVKAISYIAQDFKNVIDHKQMQIL